MALNINTIKQASPKANNVATEQYVDRSIANIDVSGDINANNDAFAIAQGFASYSDMVTKYSALGKSIVTGGYINTGLVNADSILANSISADRLIAGTNSSTVWSGGGLVSENFNGNPYGNIGSPTQGFRLSSNAAGTSADPNIYGAYIKGSTIEGISLNIADVKVKSSVYTSNFGPLYLQSFNSSSTFAVLTSTTFLPANSGSGFSDLRMCTNNSQKFMIRAGLSNSTTFSSISITLQSSINGGAWATIGAVTTGTANIMNSYLYTHYSSNVDNITFRAICSKVSGDTATVFCYLDVYSVNGQ